MQMFSHVAGALPHFQPVPTYTAKQPGSSPTFESAMTRLKKYVYRNRIRLQVRLLKPHPPLHSWLPARHAPAVSLRRCTVTERNKRRN